MVNVSIWTILSLICWECKEWNSTSKSIHSVKPCTLYSTYFFIKPIHYQSSLSSLLFCSVQLWYKIICRIKQSNLTGNAQLEYDKIEQETWQTSDEAFLKPYLYMLESFNFNLQSVSYIVHGQFLSLLVPHTSSRPLHKPESIKKDLPRPKYGWNHLQLFLQD